MREEVAAFLDYRFEKVALMKRNDEKEIWRVKIKATGEDAVMKISNRAGAPYARLKEISHPILAKIFFCTKDGTVCVEEYIEGETLSKIIEGGNFFDEDAAQDFMLQMCDGLKVLHGANIIHRDIKPLNIMRKADGQIKLIDFDIARTFKATQSKDTHRFITDGYAAPEQFGYGQTDARSDIYSLGRTLQELLGNDYHGWLEKIIAKCTEFDPKRRFQTVDELKDALINAKAETLAAENVTDYRAVEGVDTPRQVEVADKKSYGKIFVICAGVILSVGIFYAPNSTDVEEIPAEISPREEKILSTENVATVGENPVAEKSTFAEIILPQLSPPSTPTTSPAAQIVTVVAENTLPPSEDELPAKNFVRAKYFINGKRINDWQDNLTEDFEVRHFEYVPAKVWKNNTSPLNGTLEVVIENFSAESFTPQLEITFDDDGNLQTKNLSGTLLNSGQTYRFNIPLNQFRVNSLKNSVMGSAEIQVKIFDAAQIIGSSATLDFLFVQEGFPIPPD